MNEQTLPITRRKAIQGAASLLGGTVVAANLSTIVSQAALAATENAAPLFLDEDQFALVEHIVDVMIPETDTPGARTAGVHHFVDLMLADWAAPERQRRYVDGLRDLGRRLQVISGDDFVSSSPAKRLEALSDIDQAAYDTGGDDPFFREFKKLVLFAYYSSEAGATMELQYEPMTANYKACVPIEDIGRAWFWLGFSHGL